MVSKSSLIVSINCTRGSPSISCLLVTVQSKLRFDILQIHFALGTAVQDSQKKETTGGI